MFVFHSRSWPRSVDSCCPVLVWNCRTWRSAPRACLTVKRGVDETAKEMALAKLVKVWSKGTVLWLFYKQFANLFLWYHFRRALWTLKWIKLIRYDKFSALSNVLGPVSKCQFSVFFNQTIFMLYIMNLLIALNYIPRAGITRLIDELDSLFP